ncbi:MAG: DUF2752 domain-containing protein [Cytophagales bacterium]|nr:DUF2752 domain-containing protein [Cytophagales bacterium]MDW8384226.1 DUF2752 domain-containing protein [Flammeovirgaceae bacterium]
MILIPIILVLLPADFFDRGQSLCLSVLLFDVECYGCGMTRALMHLFHFDFRAAWDLNKISFLVFPILSYLYFQELLQSYHKYRFAKQDVHKVKSS